MAQCGRVPISTRDKWARHRDDEARPKRCTRETEQDHGWTGANLAATAGCGQGLLWTRTNGRQDGGARGARRADCEAGQLRCLSRVWSISDQRMAVWPIQRKSPKPTRPASVRTRRASRTIRSNAHTEQSRRHGTAERGTGWSRRVRSYVKHGFVVKAVSFYGNGETCVGPAPAPDAEPGLCCMRGNRLKWAPAITRGRSGGSLTTPRATRSRTIPVMCSTIWGATISSRWSRRGGQVSGPIPPGTQRCPGWREGGWAPLPSNTGSSTRNTFCDERRQKVPWLMVQRESCGLVLSGACPASGCSSAVPPKEKRVFERELTRFAPQVAVIRLGDGASGANCVVTSHALKKSETAKQHTTHNTHHTRIKPGVAFLFVVARMFAPSVGTMMNGEHAFATSGGTAWRRRQRRLRAFQRYVLWHSKMEVAAALHHTSGLRTSSTAAATQSASDPVAVVGSLPPCEVFAAPVFDHVPVVREQVIVQAIPRAVGSLPPVAEFAGPVYDRSIRNSFLQVTRLRILRISLLCRTRCSFRQFLVSLVHFLLLKILLFTLRGGHHLLSRCGRLYEHSGTPWRVSASLPPWCKSSMLLCCSWWTTERKPYGYWIDRWPSRLSQCPQFLALRVHRVLLFLSRSQRISWLKCRPFLSPTRIALQIAEQIVDTSVPRGRARGSLPEQSSAAHRPAQSSRRRFTGRIWHMPAAGLYGYIESDSAKAAYAFEGDVPFFLAGSCRLGDHVTFAVGRGAAGLEAYDLKVVGRRWGAWHPLTPSWVPRAVFLCLLASSPTTVAVHGWFYWWQSSLSSFLLSRRQAQDARHHGRYGREGQRMFAHLQAPCIWQSLVRCLSCRFVQAYGFFWEMISGMVSVCFLSVRQWLHVRRLSTAACIRCRAKQSAQYGRDPEESKPVRLKATRRHRTSLPEVAPERGWQMPNTSPRWASLRRQRREAICADTGAPETPPPSHQPDDPDAGRWLPSSRLGASVPEIGLARGGVGKLHPLGRVGQVFIHVIRSRRRRWNLSWEKTVRTSRKRNVGDILGTSSCWTMSWENETRTCTRRKVSTSNDLLHNPLRNVFLGKMRRSWTLFWAKTEKTAKTSTDQELKCQRSAMQSAAPYSVLGENLEDCLKLHELRLECQWSAPYSRVKKKSRIRASALPSCTSRASRTPTSDKQAPRSSKNNVQVSRREEREQKRTWEACVSSSSSSSSAPQGRRTTETLWALASAPSDSTQRPWGNGGRRSPHHQPPCLPRPAKTGTAHHIIRAESLQTRDEPMHQLCKRLRPHAGGRGVGARRPGCVSSPASSTSAVFFCPRRASNFAGPTSRQWCRAKTDALRFVSPPRAQASFTPPLGGSSASNISHVARWGLQKRLHETKGNTCEPRCLSHQLFRQLRCTEDCASSTGWTDNLGHFNNLLGNRDVQDLEGLHHLFSHQRHGGIEQRNDRHAVDELPHGVALNPLLRPPLDERRRQHPPSSCDRLLAP